MGLVSTNKHVLLSLAKQWYFFIKHLLVKRSSSLKFYSASKTEKLEIEMRENKQHSSTFQKRVVRFYEKNKFPITIEPLLLFSSIAYGLAEV